MASITVNTNGQTLTVNASISHWTTAALAVTASASDDIPSTDTTTITSNYTMHFSNTADTAVITVGQIDGTTLYTGTLDVSPGTGPRTLNPLPDQYQQAADTRTLTRAFTDKVTTHLDSTMERERAISSTTMTSQALRGGFFTATRSYTSTGAFTRCTATAAGATPTICRYGLWTVSSTDALTALVASTTNDTALWGTINTDYVKAWTTPYAVVAGTRYFAGALCVTGATAPTIVASADGDATFLALAPRVTGTVTGQADLPASVVAGSVSASTARAYVGII